MRISDWRSDVCSSDLARRAKQARFDDATIETDPEVGAAQGRLNQARVDLARTVIRATVDGVIDQRRVAVGQRVQPGVPIMVVVPIESMYVDAKFKEGQLTRVRSGQPVRVTSDPYGTEVVYRGRVAGTAGVTGLGFAPLPPPNPPGHWTRACQRLPMHIPPH